MKHSHRCSTCLAWLLFGIAGACGEPSTQSSDPASDSDSESASPANSAGEGGGADEGETAQEGGESLETGGVSSHEADGGTLSEMGSVVDAEAAEMPVVDELFDGQVCDASERVGTFKIYLGGDRTFLSGSVLDRVNPRGRAEVLDDAGGCTLFAPPKLLCGTPCGTGETCAGEDQCVPTPEKISAGTLSVDGTVEPLEVTPNGITFDYSTNIQEPYPGFEPGSEILLAASGAEISAFDLAAWGVPEFSTELSSVPVSKGNPVLLFWDTADVDPSQSEVYLSFTVNAHGTTTGWIECTAPDTGSFEIPAALVTALMDLGLSGFPRVELGRRSTDRVQTNTGCVDLRVSTEVTLDLEIDGLISCSGDEDCPDGQSCSVELACEEAE